MSRPVLPRYQCALCGKSDKAENMIFSTHLRVRYCADDRACDRRSRRRKVAK